MDCRKGALPAEGYPIPSAKAKQQGGNVTHNAIIQKGW